MLVVTRLPLQDESFRGYLLRLAEANGYRSPALVWELFHGLDGRVRKSVCPRKLAAATNISIAVATSLASSNPTRAKGATRVRDHLLAPTDMALSNPRYCPECLSQHGRWDAFWELSQAVACPEHRVRLCSDCHHCGAKLTWNLPGVHLCRCGADLRQRVTGAAPKAVCDLMKLIQGKFLFGDGAPPVAGLEHLSHLTLRSLSHLVRVLASVAVTPEICRTQQRRTVDYTQVACVASLLSDWPRPFNAWLQANYQELTELPVSPPFNIAFGWSYFRLRRTETMERDYEFLHAQIYAFALTNWTTAELPACAMELARVEPRWGTLKDAHDLLGWHLATLRKRIDNGMVPVRSIRDKFAQTLVDLQWAREQKISVHPPVDQREAARLMGVSNGTVLALLQRKVLRRSYRANGLLAREDVAEFAERLAALGKGKKMVRDATVGTLYEIFYKHRSPADERARVIELLLAEPALVVGKVRSHPGIDSYQVDVVNLEQCLKLEGHRTELVLAGEVARRFECSAHVVTRLIAADALAVRTFRGKKLVTLSSVTVFEEKYLRLRDIAEQIGISILTAYRAFRDYPGEVFRLELHKATTVFVERRHEARATAWLRRRCRSAG